ncbi:hypothetical protein SAMN05192574_12155 [Mucilaginibacter gossypiicola]|uniref:Uncharacterized protein n=1 Tax=Mucilaginibacter gossypiicola TaxID=551995 RepID=A0A1H8UZJ5_9SPHI|nr:hypothetical protein [Mucilaginibacter gossypiicola]SEP08585.1 hypothetical protein SAMN05192574_12155 [Mucilaginibacter gossypiicola]
MKHILTLPLIAMIVTSCDFADSIKHSVKHNPKDLDKTFTGFYVHVIVKSIEGHKPTLSDTADLKSDLLTITKGVEPNTYNVGGEVYTVENDNTLIHTIDGIDEPNRVNIDENTGLLNQYWDPATGKGIKYFKLK